MTAYQLLHELEAAGFQVSAAPTGLTVSPASRLTTGQRGHLQAMGGEVARVAEIRHLLELLGCGRQHPDHALALGLAIERPHHIEGLRASTLAEGLL